MNEKTEGQRADVWLWRTRFYKTRSLAAAAVEKGGARLESAGRLRRLNKASSLLRPGDRLTLMWNKQIVRLEVLGLAERRGPASEARTCYRLIEDGDEVSQGEKAGGRA